MAAANVFEGVPALPQLMSAVDEDQTMQGHFAVVFGAVCGALAIDLHSTVITYLFGILQTVIASSVRLGRIGPMEVGHELGRLGSLEVSSKQTVSASCHMLDRVSHNWVNRAIRTK